MSRPDGAVPPPAGPAAPTDLAPDAVLPHRDHLLDPAVMARRLPLLLGRPDAGAATLVRAKYRIGESVRATYRVPVPGGPDLLVSGRMFPAGRVGTEVERSRARGGAPVADPALETVFWVFPDDRRLDGLGAVLDPPAEARALVPGWTTSRLLACAPEKAATAACLGPDGVPVGFAKVYAGDGAVRAHEILAVARTHASAQTDSGGLRPSALTVPAPLGLLPEHRMLLQSVAPGTPLADLPLAAWPAAMPALGAALATVHTMPTGHLTPFARMGPRRVARAAELVAAAVPAVADDVAALAADLLASVPARHGSPVALHGDVHPRNVLVQEGGAAVSLVDLDQAATGSPAADLAAAVVRLHHPRPGVTAATGAVATSALLDGYAAAAPWGVPDDAELGWHVAAVPLVERALRFVNCVDVTGIALLPRVLADARTWLRRSGAAVPLTEVTP